MEFDNEEGFPGLYHADGSKRNNDSDCNYFLILFMILLQRWGDLVPIGFVVFKL